MGAALESVKIPNELSNRILTETEVFKLIEYTPKLRDKALIRFLYSTAVRVEEAHKMCWKDINNGVLTVHGKGGKNRFIRLTEETLELLESIRPEDWQPDDPVWVSQKGKSTLYVQDVGYCQRGSEASGNQEGRQPALYAP